MSAYFNGMLRYFEFSGRSSRSQYWLFFLVQTILMIAAIWGDYQLGGLDRQNPAPTLTLFVMFVHIVPGVTVQVRRLHDIGRSGFWYLVNFVPLGTLVLLYWACLASEDRDNYYDTPAPPAGKSKYMSIPQGVRMGTGRTSAVGGQKASSTSDGRFI